MLTEKQASVQHSLGTQRKNTMRDDSLIVDVIKSGTGMETVITERGRNYKRLYGGFGESGNSE